MPFKKKRGHDDCKPGQWAVINADTDRVLGCHDTEESADKQLAALAAKEADKDTASRTHWVDEFAATRVLSGDPVCILPKMDDGYHRWGVQHEPIGEATLSKVLANWDSRTEIPGLVANIPLTIEHDELAGKIGTISGLMLMDDGLYGTFDLTARGRELLSGDSFDYLSPEIYWDFERIDSGASVGPALVGVAVTNYPFFGEKTAMYSNRAASKLSALIKAEAGEGMDEDVDNWNAVAAMLESYGWQMADLASTDGHSDLSQKFGVLFSASRLAHGLPQRLVVEAVADTKEGGDSEQYPRSAWLVNGGEPQAWLYRLKRYNDSGVLVADEPAIMDIVSGIGEGDPLYGTLETICASLGVDFHALIGNQEELMDEKNKDGGESPQTVDVEEFATLRNDFAAMKQRLTERETEIATLRHERVLAKYAHEAEKYSALGVEVNEYATHMAWLAAADPDGEHLKWFSQVITSADQAISRSDAFKQTGRDGEPDARTDTFSQVDKEIARRAEAAGVVASPGTSEYATLLSDVFAEMPELFASYRQTVIQEA